MRPYLRENVDTPPFWPIFYKNADPPIFEWNSTRPPPKKKLFEFHLHSPKNMWICSTPPPKKQKFKNQTIWNATPVTPITPIIYQIFLPSKRGCLQKKTELNIFVIGGVIAILSLKGKNILFSWKYFLHKKMSIIQSIFKIWSQIFVLMVTAHTWKS